MDFTIKRFNMTSFQEELENLDLEQFASSINISIPSDQTNEGDLMGLYLSNVLIAFTQSIHLDWDTEFFGYNSYKLQVTPLENSSSMDAGYLRLIQKSLKHLMDNGAEFVSSRISLGYGQIIRALEKSGFESFDWGCVLRLSETSSGKSNSILSEDVDIRRCTENDVWSLMQIAADSFTHDRFHTDVRFGKEQADAMHAQWIRNLFYNENSNVYVVDKRNSILGFVTFQDEQEMTGNRNSKVIRIPLIAVRQDWTKKGLGRALVDCVINFAKNRNISVAVGTQLTNNAAMNLYMSKGFEPTEFYTTLHKWFD